MQLHDRAQENVGWRAGAADPKVVERFLTESRNIKLALPLLTLIGLIVRHAIADTFILSNQRDG